ncbi:hypothetical protein K488DRAFT_85347 [Vararia minispora EC-137]|uniref:Uncharacterized protein n=1 Tax=Vararia minispora EC-137 TaxID=1314806 RepID=A0ACB8QMN8_9AGAM|nr:hypothetical protein K488DRAFT_85347 [Vararia minispora EC-137]
MAPTADAPLVSLEHPAKPLSIVRPRPTMALLTPPSTAHRKRRRTSESSSSPLSDQTPAGPVPKRRRTGDKGVSSTAVMEEQAFWFDVPTAKAPVAAATKPCPKPSRSKGRPAASARRHLRSKPVPHHKLSLALLTPPPTRVRSHISPPATPLCAARTSGPVRDSPDNVFLACSPPIPRPHAPRDEPQLIYFVHRGQRHAFLNPYFAQASSAPAHLHPHDPDFSPEPACPPLRLFQAELAASDGVDAEGEEPCRRLARDFARVKSRLDDDGGEIGPAPRLVRGLLALAKQETLASVPEGKPVDA